MDFSTKEEIAAPIEAVFSVLTDFQTMERLAVRRGIKIQRSDTLENPGIGMCWDAQFSFKGNPRDVTIEVADYETPNLLVLSNSSGGLDVGAKIELTALSPTRTRMNFDSTVAAKTLSARLLAKSLMLAKGTLDKKFKSRIGEFARYIEMQSRTKA